MSEPVEWQMRCDGPACGEVLVATASSDEYAIAKLYLLARRYRWRLDDGHRCAKHVELERD